jgi:predicted nucleic acid-binding protein
MAWSVYLETSFVSECVSDRIDPVSTYRRTVSVDWWNSQRDSFNCFISAEVIAELRRPQYPHSSDALKIIRDVPLLPATDEALGLARLLIREKVMPGPLTGDAIHVAIAAVHGMEYILTWNVRHLANPNKVAHLGAICLRVGIMPPQIVTPDLLWEKDDEAS